MGAAEAKLFAQEGAKVVIGDVLDAEGRQTEAEINEAGGECLFVNLNVASEDSWAEAIAATVARFGKLDIIVNNAGYTWDNVIQKMSDEQFQAVIDVHLTAPFRILRAAAGPIRAAAKQEAAEGKAVYRKVVNISSVSGVYGNAGQANYSSGKLGVVGLTKTLAKEWGRYRVTVNAVAFGLVHTRLTQALENEGASVDIAGREIAVGVHRERLDAIAQTIPLGRGGTPEEAAGAVYLFCIPESDYVSGQLLVCDGGGR
jgi:3-oxoacyl-[acyl-carrier protein] reductase